MSQCDTKDLAHAYTLLTLEKAYTFRLQQALKKIMLCKSPTEIVLIAEAALKDEHAKVESAERCISYRGY